MDKKLLKDPTAKELANWKQEEAELRAKRAELMRRLIDAGWTMEKVAQVYGCTRQAVGQFLAEMEKK